MQSDLPLSPSRLEQARALLSQLDSGWLDIVIGVRSSRVAGLTVPAGSMLHATLKWRAGAIVAEDALIELVDRDGARLALQRGLLKVDRLSLRAAADSEPSADLLVWFRLWWLSLHWPIKRRLPLAIDRLIGELAMLTDGRGDTTSQPSDGSEAALALADLRYQAVCTLAPGAALLLNAGTAVHTAANGNAALRISGSRVLTTATITGTGIELDTAMLSTGPSDIDVRIELDRRDGGIHRIGFDHCTLRNVRLKSSDLAAPPVDELQIVATPPAADGTKSYDFLISIDPANKFTLKDLTAWLTAKVGNPATIAKLKQKLAAKAGESNGASAVVLDSTRWNIASYLTRDLKLQLKETARAPDIAAALGDPAIDAIVANAMPRLRAFILATQLQLASAYNPRRLVELTRRLLADENRVVLEAAAPGSRRALLEAIGYPASEAMSLAGAATAASDGLSARLDALMTDVRTPSSQALAELIRGIGHGLNQIERRWLRETWVSAGGMESQGQAYLLLARLAEVLTERISLDPKAPEALKKEIEKLPAGDALHAKIAVAADNIRGAIWAAQGVLKDGWQAVSEHLESRLAERYGEQQSGGAQAFLAQSRTVDGEPFVATQLRYLGDGEEFFAQMLKLLDDNEAVFDGQTDKGPIGLNYWAIQSSGEPGTGSADVWGLRIAERLRTLALAGFTISIVVDEKNGPSRKGQRRLAEIAAEVAAAGIGRFTLTRWTPEAERFPLGSHVKYLVSPLGVIAGGSNLGDHYAHWSDTNILLRGEAVVAHFWAMHQAVLAEQRAVGQPVPEQPRLLPRNPLLWNALDRTKQHGELHDVFNAHWADVRMRTFRDQGGDADDRILLEMMAALGAARGSAGGRPDTVYIANAYFVLTQPIDHHPVARAISSALERGVDIELLTNSADSSDEPAVAGPIVKSAFLILERASEMRHHAQAEGREVGTLTVHLPSASYIGKDGHGVPLITIHDKIMFFANMSFVTTMNLHPRSFTLEQELLTELVGADEPAAGQAHAGFIETARHFVAQLTRQPGGDRAADQIEALLAPLQWHGDDPPRLWDTAGWLYLLWLRKRFLYCETFSSRSDQDVVRLDSKLVGGTQASLADLMMNIF